MQTTLAVNLKTLKMGWQMTAGAKGAHRGVQPNSGCDGAVRRWVKKDRREERRGQKRAGRRWCGGWGAGARGPGGPRLPPPPLPSTHLPNKSRGRNCLPPTGTHNRHPNPPSCSIQGGGVDDVQAPGRGAQRPAHAAGRLAARQHPVGLPFLSSIHIGGLLASIPVLRCAGGLGLCIRSRPKVGSPTERAPPSAHTAAGPCLAPPSPSMWCRWR